MEPGRGGGGGVFIAAGGGQRQADREHHDPAVEGQLGRARQQRHGDRGSGGGERAEAWAPGEPGGGEREPGPPAPDIDEEHDALRNLDREEGGGDEKNGAERHGRGLQPPAAAEVPAAGDHPGGVACEQQREAERQGEEPVQPVGRIKDADLDIGHKRAPAEGEVIPERQLALPDGVADHLLIGEVLVDDVAARWGPAEKEATVERGEEDRQHTERNGAVGAPGAAGARRGRGRRGRGHRGPDGVRYRAPGRRGVDPC